ncbi:DUF2059 domain-containing protein [Neisseria sp.]|uniref:DUF2059 domain-containing protein n=1 Tax=Neisseria sp. TaxID=192066 RepID=UPI0035A15A14
MKKSLIAITAALLLAAGCTSTAPKGQAQHSAAPSRASLEELFNVSDFDRVMDSSFRQIPAMMQPQIQSTLEGVPVAKRAAVQGVVEKYINLMVQETNTPELRSEIRRSAIESSAKVYTQGEVDALIKFYKTSEGRSVMAKMPQLMQATMTPMMQVVQPKIQAFQQKYAAQMGREIGQAICGRNTCPMPRKTKK